MWVYKVSRDTSSLFGGEKGKKGQQNDSDT